MTIKLDVVLAIVASKYPAEIIAALRGPRIYRPMRSIMHQQYHKLVLFDFPGNE